MVIVAEVERMEATEAAPQDKATVEVAAQTEVMPAVAMEEVAEETVQKATEVLATVAVMA
jgi:hypothetical protein